MPLLLRNFDDIQFERVSCRNREFCFRAITICCFIQWRSFSIKSLNILKLKSTITPFLCMKSHPPPSNKLLCGRLAVIAELKHMFPAIQTQFPSMHCQELINNYINILLYKLFPMLGPNMGCAGADSRGEGAMAPITDFLNFYPILA